MLLIITIQLGILGYLIASIEEELRKFNKRENKRK